MNTVANQGDASAAEKVAGSQPMGWVARVGLGARATVYLIMGVLAIAVAAGNSRTSVDQRGAMRTVLHQPFGTLLGWLFGVSWTALAAAGLVAARRRWFPRRQAAAPD